MNCPFCFHIMENHDERHKINFNLIRMNLHCFRRGNCLGTHFGVIVPPPEDHQEWICDFYHLKFSDNRNIELRANTTPRVKKDVNGKYVLDFLPEDKFTELYSYIYGTILRVPFIPLSTNNDMHEHANYVYNKLLKLIPFA